MVKALVVKYPKDPKQRVRVRQYLATVAVKYGALWIVPHCSEHIEGALDVVLQKVKELGAEVEQIELDMGEAELRKYLLARLEALKHGRNGVAKAEARVVKCALAQLGVVV